MCRLLRTDQPNAATTALVAGLPNPMVTWLPNPRVSPRCQFHGKHVCLWHNIVCLTIVLLHAPDAVPEQIFVTKMPRASEVICPLSWLQSCQNLGRCMSGPQKQPLPTACRCLPKAAVAKDSHDRIVPVYVRITIVGH